MCHISRTSTGAMAFLVFGLVKCKWQGNQSALWGAVPGEAHDYATNSLQNVR